MLDFQKIIKDPETGELRINELTSLMIACIMCNKGTVQLLVEEAKKRLSEAEFKLFINIKVDRSMGGNNALLYACSSSNPNYFIV